MKKVLVAAILGLAATASVMAQGRILLDSYASAVAPYPLITYGAGSGGTLGNPVTGGYTVGVYYSLAANTFVDPSGNAEPGAGWTLATGSGSTVAIATGGAGPGYFTSSTDLAITGATASPLYLIVVAYNGASYANATVRGHSAVFTVNPNTGFGGGTPLGGAMSTFAVSAVAPIPEPSTFALAGLGLAGLLIFRRRK